MLGEPSITDELQTLKKRLKSWEAEFTSKEGYKPGKDDIENGPVEVKDAYQQYKKLKRQQEQTKSVAANDVWGPNCNKTKPLKDSAKSSTTTKCEDSVMDKIGMKLKAAALIQTKKLPAVRQDTQKPVRNTSKVSVFKANSQDRCDRDHDIAQKKNTYGNESQPPPNENIKDNAQGEKLSCDSPKSGIFSKALQLSKFGHSVATPGGKRNHDEAPSFVRPSLVHKRASLPPGWHANADSLVKEPEISPSSSRSPSRGNIIGSEKSFEGEAMDSELNKKSWRRLDQMGMHDVPSQDQQGKESVTMNTPPLEKETHFEERSSTSKEMKAQTSVSLQKKLSTERTNVPFSDFGHTARGVAWEPICDKRRNKVSSEDKKSIPDNLDQSSENGLNSAVIDKNEDSGNNGCLQNNAAPSGSKRKRQPSKVMNDDVGAKFSRSEQWREENGNSENDQDLSEEEEIKPKKRKVTKARTIAPKPISSENFVRLNMKVKKFSKKSKLNFKQYKRQQWKKKVGERSKSYGNKCFKCGQEGHWANKCPNKGNSFGASKEEADDGFDASDFPSLREAAMMARGIKPSDRTQDSKEETSTKERGTGKAPNKAPDRTQYGGTVQEEPPSVPDISAVELEDEMVVRVTRESLPPRPSMEPYYQPYSDSTPHAVTKDVYKALNKFGYTAFRPGQEEAITRILSGLSTLVVLSTGAGKSLCYQLPAYMYAQKTKSIALVISPLVSLMEDQVTGLPPGIHGACLHTNMTKVQRERVIESVTEGKVHFLLVSPEAIVGGGGTSGCFPTPASLPPIAFACIDEVHCVSEWSHHFRPSYLRLCKVLKERLGVHCFLGLTATATLSTASSVAQHLGITDYKQATIRGAPVPPNLTLSVSRDEDKEQALIDLLQGERFASLDSIIIYCSRRQQTERLATLIRTCLKDKPPLENEESKAVGEDKKKKGKGGKAKATKPKSAGDAESYHAGMTAAQRKRVQNAFMSGRLRIVVATVAFGMGLDKADVRAVIHFTMPKSFESYVQEIGRAGRDGKPSHCHLFLDAEGGDMCELKRHTYANTVDRYTIKKLLKKVFTPCMCRAVQERRLQALKECAFEDDGIDYSQLDDTGAATPGTHQPLAEKPTEETTTPKKSPAPPNNADGELVLFSPPKPSRLCPGHERGIAIEKTVMDLDMKEEGISTLLCYLELHPKKWIESLQPVYATCSLQCYGGVRQLQALAKKCPPVAVAIAKSKQRGDQLTNSLDFNVVELSDCMGWDSGPVKRELKQLMWSMDTAGTGIPHKTGVMVEFSDLAFHLRSPGDLTDAELDEVLDFLNDRVQMQEKAELYQLQKLHDALQSVSFKNYYHCSDDVDMKRSDKLRAMLTDYFEMKPEHSSNMGRISKLSFSRELECSTSGPNEEDSCENEGYVRGDIRGFISLYGQEHVLSGRTIARIFHGIDSPCFPVKTWGRVRKYWRAHLDVNFNYLIKMATQELVRMR